MHSGLSVPSPGSADEQEILESRGWPKGSRREEGGRMGQGKAERPGEGERGIE